MNTIIQSVLVTTDFSEASYNAVNTAAAICQRHSATLWLLHVTTPFDISMPPMGHYAMVGAMMENIQGDTKERVIALGNETAKEWHIPCIPAEVTGQVVESIIDYSNKHQSDLIVLGSSGLTGLSEYFLGSTAFSVLKRTMRPVLAVPTNAAPLAFRNIVFPVRAVPNAIDKYDFLRPIIERNGATLHVVSLTDEKDPNQFMYVNALTTELLQTLSADGVQFSVEKYFCSDVAQTVLDLTEEKGADLLVVTSNLEQDFWQLFSVPFSKKIIDRATTAVLLVRPE